MQSQGSGFRTCLCELCDLRYAHILSQHFSHVQDRNSASFIRLLWELNTLTRPLAQCLASGWQSVNNFCLSKVSRLPWLRLSSESFKCCAYLESQRRPLANITKMLSQREVNLGFLNLPLMHVNRADHSLRFLSENSKEDFSLLYT